MYKRQALDNVLQDILIRTKRMQGVPTLWVPGTDHAAIATEAKIVAEMQEEGLTKESIGREAFLQRAWAWKDKYGGRIVEQLKKMGCSCDWSRERFTMDEGCNRAVNEVFVRLYEKGLIYRGQMCIRDSPKGQGRARPRQGALARTQTGAARAWRTAPVGRCGG